MKDTSIAKPTWRLLAAAIAVLAIAGCVGDPEPESRVSVGDPVPVFEVTLNDGSTFGRTQMAGKTTRLVFFNTDCADCRRELPLLQREADAAGPATQYVCIAREEDAETIAAYWADNALTMPWSPQPDRRVYSLFATSGIPRVYTIGPDLRILAATPAE